ncbi:DNA-protecting protein DprA [Candidatus Saccharibacteria bacterium]|nr:DNA-protecting protein DprA [Candidatus Saccharibacteria bacterium]
MFPYKVNALTVKDPGYPPGLINLHKPPNPLFYIGKAPSEWMNSPKVAVVGSRKISSYGRLITQDLVGELGRAGVTIISGLAYGIDATAHWAALEARATTVAVLPTGLDRVYPAAHYNLAKSILTNGGTLTSECQAGSEVFKVNFIARNRIVSGLADLLLITEAAANSGTLHTAQFALEQGKTVMAVPGNINSAMSEGCNNLIKSGAIPVTSAADVFFALGINPERKQQKVFRGAPHIELVFKLISKGTHSQEELALESKLTSSSVNSALTTLEVSGYIRAQGNGRWIKA